jgi:acetoacetyl-CoA synthetase
MSSAIGFTAGHPSMLGFSLHQGVRTLLPAVRSLLSFVATLLTFTVVGANTMASIHKGELAAANLGMKVEIFDTEGKNIEWSGEKGDLVITRPFLSMPVTFWGRDGMEKYRKAYFDEFPGVWNHGDFIRRNPRTGGYEILGRSDGVLNPGGKHLNLLVWKAGAESRPVGVRFGTAEIYGIVDKFSQVEDYIAVGQRRDHDTDEQVLLFLKMKSGSLDAQLRKEIASMIRSLLSPRHVPAYILQVKDIPYTMNGKRIEHIVRDTVCGRPAKIGGTAVNPECLEEYRQFLKLPQSIEKSRL